MTGMTGEELIEREGQLALAGHSRDPAYARALAASWAGRTFVLVRVPLEWLDFQYDPTGRYFGDDPDKRTASAARTERTAAYAAMPTPFPPIVALFNERSARRAAAGLEMPRLWVTSGNHRSAAAALRGDDAIDAYVPADDWGRFMALGNTRANPSATVPPCSCGHSEAHPVANKLTADGVAVVLWSDGPVTGRMGYALEGVPVVRPKTAKGQAAALAAGRIFMGEVELYDHAEIGLLYAACRWAADRGGDAAEARERLKASLAPRLVPTWEVISTDRDGNPTVRVWRLPRLRWPGLAVWDHVSVGASGGRYELMAVDRSGVCTRTGFRFSKLSDLARHLHEHQGQRTNPQETLFSGDRERWPDGRLKPVEGEEVWTPARGAFGTQASIRGRVYRAKGKTGGLRVKITGSSSMWGGGTSGSKTDALSERWSVVGDPWFEERERARAEKAAREAAEREARQRAEQAEAAAAREQAIASGAWRPIQSWSEVKVGDHMLDPAYPRVVVVTEFDDRGEAYGVEPKLAAQGQAGGSMGDPAEWLLAVGGGAATNPPRSKLCQQGRHDFSHETGACTRKGCPATLTTTMFPMTTAEEEQAYGFSAEREAQGFKPGDQQTGLFMNPPHLPEDPWRYFQQVPGTQLVPLASIRPIRAREGGIQRAGDHMRLAYEGRGQPRKPITLAPAPEGGYLVCDGNSTYANAAASGWHMIPATIERSCDVAHNPDMRLRDLEREAITSEDPQAIERWRAEQRRIRQFPPQDQTEYRRLILDAAELLRVAGEELGTAAGVATGYGDQDRVRWIDWLANRTKYAARALARLKLGVAGAAYSSHERGHQPVGLYVGDWLLAASSKVLAATALVRDVALAMERPGGGGRERAAKLFKVVGWLNDLHSTISHTADRYSGWSDERETLGRPMPRMANPAAEASELDWSGDYTRLSQGCTLQTLEALHSPGGRLIPSELARETSCSVSSVRSALKTLVAGGFVRQLGSRGGFDLKGKTSAYEITEKGEALLEWRREREAIAGESASEDTSFDPQILGWGGRQVYEDDPLEVRLRYEVTQEVMDGPIRITVYDQGVGFKVGTLDMVLHQLDVDDKRHFSGFPSQYAVVTSVRVHPDYRRLGVGTKLHELAAQEAARQGLPLASPDDRTRTEGGFWAKQERKGRAKLGRFHHPIKPGASRYLLKYPPPATLQNPPQGWG